MKKRSWFALLFSVVALVLEILPYGAVLKFAVDEGKGTKREFFSCFDMTVYGNGNVFPLMTGILTVVLVALLVIFLVKQNEKRGKSAFLISLCATVISVFPPVIFGLDYLSVVGAIITACLLICALILFQKEALK